MCAASAIAHMSCIRGRWASLQGGETAHYLAQGAHVLSNMLHCCCTLAHTLKQSLPTTLWQTPHCCCCATAARAATTTSFCSSGVRTTCNRPHRPRGAASNQPSLRFCPILWEMGVPCLQTWGKAVKKTQKVAYQLLLWRRAPPLSLSLPPGPLSSAAPPQPLPWLPLNCPPTKGTALAPTELAAHNRCIALCVAACCLLFTHQQRERGYHGE